MDCCKWDRIQCNNRTGHIVMLDLRSKLDMPMRGELSTSILELRHLSYLDLSCTSFNVTTDFPNLIGSFSKLRYLNLSTALAGNFPYQIGNLSSLRSLDLSYNNFGQVENLEWLSHLSSLQYLNLLYVDLSMAANWLQEINMLPSLKNLNLMLCRLRDPNPPLPSLFNFSRSLSTLDLSMNFFLTSSIFSWLPNISTSLVDLRLRQCLIEGPFPDVFWNMTSLANLDLGWNKFKGGIPQSLGNLCNLRTLDLTGMSANDLTQPLRDTAHNLFTGCSADALEVLSLAYNNFSGTLPDFTRFSSLRELYLDNNQLNGSIPESFGQLPNLVIMSVQGNQLSGPLPYFRKSLRALLVSNNQLNGSLTKSIGQLSDLVYLYVSANNFEDVITEAHLLNFSKLQHLDLSSNSLVLNLSSNWVPPFQLQTLRLSSCKMGDKFPKWLQWQKNITQLDISNNGISDILPSWFSQFTPTLGYLNLSYNQFTGMLPISSFSVIVLDLSFNQFEGPLPLFPTDSLLLDLSNNMFSGSISSICNITYGSLTLLDFSKNMLSGSIPDCWTQVNLLKVLSLANNNFTGEIPTSIGSLSFLQTLHLHDNSLSGELPISLRNCTRLQLMDVGGNRLSGEIPAWIGGSLSSLIILNLRSNTFFGSIPLNLCQLTSIRILDLSHNNLSGTIPWCVSNFSVMAQKENSGEPIVYGYLLGMYVENTGYLGSYKENASVTWKGKRYEFGKNLGLLKVIDLSSNSLSGNIPDSMTSLLGLVALNLSRNHLEGTIPEMIGDMSQLQSLDFSRNNLSGEIPTTMANLNFLQYLDLSNNALSGKIPSGTQLQSFNTSQYSGNPKLCGPPLVKKCQEDKTPPAGSPSEDNEIEESENWHGMPWFYVSAGLGFLVGFWGVCFTLVFKSSWRYAFFGFLENVKDKLYVIIVVSVAKLRRQFRS